MYALVALIEIKIFLTYNWMMLMVMIASTLSHFRLADGTVDIS